MEQQNYRQKVSVDEIRNCYCSIGIPMNVKNFLRLAVTPELGTNKCF